MLCYSGNLSTSSRSALSYPSQVKAQSDFAQLQLYRPVGGVRAGFERLRITEVIENMVRESGLLNPRVQLWNMSVDCK